MSFALVIFYDRADVSVPEAELAALHGLLGSVPGVTEAVVFTPSTARDLYVADGAPPPLGVQLHFATLEELETACEAGGALAGMAAVLPSLAGIRADAQAFWRRTWSVPEPRPADRMCSYVVHYIGPAQDLNAWLKHYVAGHPPIFQRFPGIRGIEILTRVDWISGLPFDKADHMQRNRVTFDSPEALTAALTSPVRHELRADFHNFPPFEGGNYHYPMWTDRVALA
ncbi:MAG: EthD family reductase [Pseudooceanicola sp.]|nr:EthD family reductase [Pseudooceanicola sp.]